MEQRVTHGCPSTLRFPLIYIIYNSVIRPVVLYGFECWVVKKMNEKCLLVAEMRMLRWMCEAIRMDKVRNEYMKGV